MPIRFSARHNTQCGHPHATPLIFDGHALFEVGCQHQGQLTRHQVCRTTRSIRNNQFDRFIRPSTGLRLYTQVKAGEHAESQQDQALRGKI